MSEFRCPIEGCTEPDVIAYICHDGCLVHHRDLDHWAGAPAECGEPRMPNHHTTWSPLQIPPKFLAAEAEWRATWDHPGTLR